MIKQLNAPIWTTKSRKQYQPTLVWQDKEYSILNPNESDISKEYWSDVRTREGNHILSIINYVNVGTIFGLLVAAVATKGKIF